MKDTIVKGFRLDKERIDKLEFIMSKCPFNNYNHWLKSVIDTQYDNIVNDKQHLKDIKLLVSILDSMLYFQTGYDTDRARVRQSQKAVSSLKDYLNNLVAEEKK